MDTNITIDELKEHAKQLRKNVISMIYEAKSGHPGGALSAADIITALYFKVMNIDPKKPKWEDRDRFVLSKGHGCPILYSALGRRGYFDEKHFHTLRKEGSILQGHPCMKMCPGIDISTGSLGQGLSAGVGMALAAKRDGRDYRVFVLIGDGETNEGQIWEAIMSAYALQLDNLVIILDNNGLQVEGECSGIIPLLDMNEKLKAFGYDTCQIDGHNIEEIVSAIDRLILLKNGKPKFINAHTVKGKGISYMENVLKWHALAPNPEEYERAISDLEGGF